MFLTKPCFFFQSLSFVCWGGQICRHLQLLVDSWGFEYWSTKHNSLWGFNQSQCLGSFRASVKIVIYCWKMLPGVQKVGWISMILNQIASPNETYICSIYQLATVSLGLCIFIYTGIYIYMYTIGYLYLPVYTELGGAITKMPIKMCILRTLPRTCQKHRHESPRNFSHRNLTTRYGTNIVSWFANTTLDIYMERW